MTARSGRRARSLHRCRKRAAEARVRVAVRVPVIMGDGHVERVTAVLSLPLARRALWDLELLDRIRDNAARFAARNLASLP